MRNAGDCLGTVTAFCTNCAHPFGDGLLRGAGKYSFCRHRAGPSSGPGQCVRPAPFPLGDLGRVLCGRPSTRSDSSQSGNRPMNAANRPTGANSMEIVFVLGFLALWIALQAWILPRFGVST